MKIKTDQGKGMQMLQNSFKSVILGAAVVCLSAGVARDSKADAASCASPIPFGLTTCGCRKLNPGILVMQPAQDWATKNVPGAIDGARDRRILLQG
jgi:hypothetical protein